MNKHFVRKHFDHPLFLKNQYFEEDIRFDIDFQNILKTINPILMDRIVNEKLAVLFLRKYLKVDWKIQ